MDSGMPLTDEQMKQQASFVGWDFVWETANGTEDIWAICEGASYPKLACQFIPGDFDNDKKVDFVDFARLAVKWRQTDSTLYCGGADLTGDGVVDFNDLAFFAAQWLTTGSSPSGIVISQSVLSFSTPVYYISDFNGSASITVTRSGVLSDEVCVDYFTSDGGTANAGCDYSSVSGTLCFPPNVTSSSFSVPISLTCATSQEATVNLRLSNQDGSTILNAVLVIQRPKPILAVCPTSLTLVAQGNCPQYITISNTGPVGSILNYTVADDGALGGFLNINGNEGFWSGSLAAGESDQVSISVLERFATNWIGGDMTVALDIYAPGASNYVKYPISVEISNVDRKLIGSWSGTWTGYNDPPSDLWVTQPLVPVGGTWTLNIQTVDSTNPTYPTASGTLTFQGTDCYWGCTTHHPLNIDLTIIFADVTINDINCEQWRFNSNISGWGEGICAEFLGDWWAPPFYYVVPPPDNTCSPVNQEGELNFVAILNTSGTVTNGSFEICYPDRGSEGSVFPPFSYGDINGSWQGP